MMASIKTLNYRLATMCRYVVVISLVVKALYPSMDINLTADVVSRMFLERGPYVEGIEARNLGLYLALNRKPEELRTLSLADY